MAVNIDTLVNVYGRESYSLELDELFKLDLHLELDPTKHRPHDRLLERNRCVAVVIAAQRPDALEQALEAVLLALAAAAQLATRPLGHLDECRRRVSERQVVKNVPNLDAQLSDTFRADGIIIVAAAPVLPPQRLLHGSQPAPQPVGTGCELVGQIRANRLERKKAALADVVDALTAALVVIDVLFYFIKPDFEKGLSSRRRRHVALRLLNKRDLLQI